MPCHVTKGCTDVLNSRFSTLAGIPIAWFGLAFYLTAFSCAVFALSGTPGIMNILFWPALLGFLIYGVWMLWVTAPEVTAAAGPPRARQQRHRTADPGIPE